jgi:hypothetical protein
MTGMNLMSLTDGYLSERQCGEPVCAGYRWREDSGVSVNGTCLSATSGRPRTSEGSHWPYRFDKNKAERFLRFAQKMPHTSGEWARRNSELNLKPGRSSPWRTVWMGTQKAGLRRFSEIYIEVQKEREIRYCRCCRKLYVLR